MLKNFKILLISLMILLVGGLNAYATTGTAEITLNTSKTEAKVDETVTFNVVVNCETGIEGFDATLEYDDSKLELQNVNVDTKFSNMSGKDEATGEYKLTVILNTVETVTQAKVATIDFKVLESAKAGDKITVKLSKIEVGDSQEEWIKIEEKNAIIEVVESNTEDNNPGEEDNNPGEEDNNPGEEDNKPGEEDNKPGGEDNNPGGEDNNPGVDDEKPSDEGNKPGVDGEKPSNDNKEDTTQADKEIDKTGIENYVLVVIGIMAICSYACYKKYKKYRNI